MERTCARCYERYWTTLIQIKTEKKSCACVTHGFYVRVQTLLTSRPKARSSHFFVTILARSIPAANEHRSCGRHTRHLLVFSEPKCNEDFFGFESVDFGLEKHTRKRTRVPGGSSELASGRIFRARGIQSNERKNLERCSSAMR